MPEIFLQARKWYRSDRLPAEQAKFTCSLGDTMNSTHFNKVTAPTTEGKLDKVLEEKDDRIFDPRCLSC